MSKPSVYPLDFSDLETTIHEARQAAADLIVMAQPGDGRAWEPVYVLARGAALLEALGVLSEDVAARHGAELLAKTGGAPPAPAPRKRREKRTTTASAPVSTTTRESEVAQ